MNGSGVPGEAVRRKAYEFWEAGGRVHGRDQEDWYRAEAALAQADAGEHAEARGLVETVPQVLGEVIADGVEAVTALATGAVSVIEEFFAHRGDKAD